MKTFQITKYKIESPKFSLKNKGIRFLFISDLHNVEFGKDSCDLIDTMKKLCPDAILIGGDLLVGKPGYSMEPAMKFIRRIGGLFPVYYALGNHEYRMRIYPETYGEMYPQYEKVLRESQITILDNKREKFSINGTDVMLYGYELDRMYYKKGKRRVLPVDEIERVFGKPNEDLFTILLAHNPIYGDTYLKWGADLTLSGHLHGGMVRMGQRAVVSPDFTLFPKYGYGLYKKGQSQMIVSGGMGEHTIPLRLFNPRELIVVDVHRSGDGE